MARKKLLKKTPRRVLVKKMLRILKNNFSKEDLCFASRSEGEKLLKNRK